jgi:hypothetical protein
MRTRNRVSQIIQPPFECWHFQAPENWYKKIGISKKRFFSIVRNEVQPTLNELDAIAKEFKIKTTDLIESSGN